MLAANEKIKHYNVLHNHEKNIYNMFGNNTHSCGHLALAATRDLNAK